MANVDNHRYSALPAAVTNSLAPGNTKVLPVCFVACKYGERAP